MTVVIGILYDSRKGAVLLADSRVMRGGDYGRDRKLFVIGNDVAFAAAGLSGIAGKLIANVDSTRRRTRRVLTSEAVDLFEDEMAELYERYKASRPYRFSDSEVLLQGMIGYVDDQTAEPRLFSLYENGYSDAVQDFQAIGHGAPYAHHILRTLYDPKMSRDRAIEIGVHAMVEVAKIDANVDDSPQIAVLQTGVEVLNVVNDEFVHDCDQITGVKTRLAGIEGKRTELFHLLLDGSPELRARFDAMLKEFENDRQGTAVPGAGTPSINGDRETSLAG